LFANEVPAPQTKGFACGKLGSPLQGADFGFMIRERAGANLELSRTLLFWFKASLRQEQRQGVVATQF
jgi:hypothetical protein